MYKLSENFLAPYKTQTPPFGDIGLIVFYRTYSRWLPEEKRREYWWEVVRRVVEYSVNLVDRRFIMPFEPEWMFDAVFNMKFFPAGRTLWVGGTPVVEKDGIANFNCAFRAIDSLESFSESLYLLMNGCGVGFSIEKKFVKKLPQFSANVTVDHFDYHYRDLGESETDVKMGDVSSTIVVGDSKEGWRDALQAYLVLHTVQGLHINIDYNNVRPEGTPLKTFGGRASGHEPLKFALTRISEIIKRSGGKLSRVDAMDIQTVIASVVVVGGVRRSSLIALGDADDRDFIEAKLNLFSDPAKAEYRSTRVMSNNSLMLYKNPGVEVFEELLRTTFYNGEPGFINAVSALARREDFEGLNPCAEILLRNFGLCNLVEIVARRHIKNGRIDYTELAGTIFLATRHCSRITEVNIKHPLWDATQKEDRLLGVSLTGIMSAVDACNHLELSEFFDFCRKEIRAVADRYHKERGIPRAKLATCIKPSGTLSQLPGVSSGIHRDYAPYYYRRVRISKHDPVAKALTMLGHASMPENGQGKDYFTNLYSSLNWKLDQGVDVSAERKAIEFGKAELAKIGVTNIPDDPTDSAYLRWSICRTKVFTFAMKSNAAFPASAESAVQQLERYRTSMKHYTEHNTSVTITFEEKEIPEIAQWLEQNFDDYVGVSFLPVFAPYPQLPYETCTKAQYEEWHANHDPINEEDLSAYIAAFETGEEWDVDGDCVGGCPVR